MQPSGRFGAAMKMQFLKQVVDVVFHGRNFDHQQAADLLVREPPADKAENLGLPSRQADAVAADRDLAHVVEQSRHRSRRADRDTARGGSRCSKLFVGERADHLQASSSARRQNRGDHAKRDRSDRDRYDDSAREVKAHAGHDLVNAS